MKVHFRRRISRQKYTILFKSFVSDIPASKVSDIAGVNRKTADRYYTLFRNALLADALSERNHLDLKNGIEVDESYFGPNRIRGKRGRGAGKKIIVLGLLKRNGCVYTQIIKSAKKAKLCP